MKEKTFSIRLTMVMQQFIKTKAREKQLLQSEYLRYILQKEMDKEGYTYGETDK